MDWAYDYVRRIRYRRGGRRMPHVDCWGAHRAIVLDRSGAELPEFLGEVDGASLAVRARRPPDWERVELGCERELDLVLMGDNLHPTLPSHCGTVVAPGWLIHCDERVNAMVKPFRDCGTARTHPTLVGRILGVYRPRVQA